MKTHKTLFLAIIIFICSADYTFGQFMTTCYNVPCNGNRTILIENGKLYRVTIKSCWYSAYARIGTYLIYGLNISDPKTSGRPLIQKVKETSAIDWVFSFSLHCSYDANFRITSSGWGDQGLMVFVEEFNADLISTSASPISFIINTDEKILTIYPNPATDFINITADKELLKGLWIDFINLDGTVVKTLRLNNPGLNTQIDIRDLVSGIYTIRAKNDKMLKICKIIKS